MGAMLSGRRCSAAVPERFRAAYARLSCLNLEIFTRAAIEIILG